MERRMLGVFSAISFLSEMYRGIFRVFFVLYLYNEIGASLKQAGIIFTLIIIVNALSQIVWGWISDRIAKRKHFIILGEGIPGLVFLFLPGITNIVTLAFVIIAVQTFWSMAAPAWKALIAEHSSPGERAGSMGKITMFGGIGSMIGIYIVGDVIPLYGYTFFFFFSAFCMFLASSTALFLREPDGLQPSHQKLLSTEQLRTLFTEHRPFSVFTLFILLSLFVVQLIDKFIPVYAEMLGGNIKQISYLYILEDGVITASMTPMGKLTDKMGRVKMLQISLLVRTSAILLFAVAPVWWYLLPVMVIENIGYSGYHVSWFAVLSSLTPRERRGTYMGFHNSIVYTLSSFAPSIGGVIADGSGFRVLFLSSFVFSIFVAIFFISWLHKHDETINESKN